MKIKEWLRVYKWPLLICISAVMGAAFLGGLGARLIPVDSQAPIQKDTIYVGNGVTDSLLKDIAIQVGEINGKIPKKTPVRRHRPRKDTIRVDASVHID